LFIAELLDNGNCGMPAVAFLSFFFYPTVPYSCSVAQFWVVTFQSWITTWECPSPDKYYSKKKKATGDTNTTTTKVVENRRNTKARCKDISILLLPFPWLAVIVRDAHSNILDTMSASESYPTVTRTPTSQRTERQPRIPT